MKKYNWKEFFKAAGIRAIKTVAQTAVGMIAVGAAINEVEWAYIASVSVVSGVVSIITSIATGLPELEVKLEEE